MKLRETKTYKFIINKEVLNYLIFGFLTLIINIIIYYLLALTILNPNDALELQIANIISWICAVIFAYLSNKIIVFKSKDKKIINEAFKFFASRFFTLIIEIVLMFILVTSLKFNDLISKITIQIIVIILNYIISKFIIFKKGKELKMKKILLVLIICLLFGCDNDDKQYLAEITVKDYGTIEVELDRKSAPITVDNFVKLAKSGFYDNLNFHRIIDGFMIQGGDGSSQNREAETIKGEFSDNGVINNISHKRGVISMARSDNPDSASSQFFIVHEDSTFLDGKYAAFGKVTKGMHFVDKLAKVEVIDDNGTVEEKNRPIIEKIEIIEKDNK